MPGVHATGGAPRGSPGPQLARRRPDAGPLQLAAQVGADLRLVLRDLHSLTATTVHGPFALSSLVADLCACYNAHRQTESEGVSPLGRKWENIKRSKAKLDQERGATFSRITKDIMKAAREGGPDPETNFLLKTAVAAARKANMPNENIQRAIARGAGLSGADRYEEIVYEGYGPGGVAIMMNIVTNNRNRTAADVRHLFSKHGGSLGESGCVSWMFQKRGVVELDRSQVPVSEDELMMVALDVGADDLQATEDGYEIYTSPEALNQVLKGLEAAGIPVEKGEIAMIPTTTVSVTGEDADKLLKLLDLLEEHDDIQNVYTNADIAES